MLNTLTRRQVVRGMAVGVPLAAVLADPLLARAAAETLESVTITTGGGRTVKAALAVPAKTPAPAVLLIHEWWGLNDQIKSVAAEYAREGYLALAIDLYGGKVATTRDGARSYMKAVNVNEAKETLVGWAQWLKAHKKATGKIGTVGWCFGGGMSLDASIFEPVDATVIYYGRVDADADELKALKGPVLGHFATRDKWINREMVGGFEAAMTAAGKAYTSHWYEADHAFANPTQARYDAEDAKLAWTRTLDFFKANL
jgi:carboxymethylenebutenolidase